MKGYLIKSLWQLIELFLSVIKEHVYPFTKNVLQKAGVVTFKLLHYVATCGVESFIKEAIGL